ncbi:MAG: universal stress protein [Pirellulaceae bacterium]
MQHWTKKSDALALVKRAKGLDQDSWQRPTLLVRGMNIRATRTAGDSRGTLAASAESSPFGEKYRCGIVFAPVFLLVGGAVVYPAPSDATILKHHGRQQMNLRNILVPTDFSESSDAAVALASSLARDSNSRLVLVHVLEDDYPVTEGMAAAYAGISAERHDEAQAALEAIKATDPDTKVERVLMEGPVAETIVEMAQSRDDIDLIVVGSHGRKGLSRLILGSVAEQIVRTATCPVLTVKVPNHVPAS